MIKWIRKRNGEIVPFQIERIIRAIEKAMDALDLGDRVVAEKLADEVARLLDSKISFYPDGIPSVEDIQEVVEEVLNKYDERLYRAYNLYRRSRAVAREVKQIYRLKDELKLTGNALRVLEERYLLKNEQGNILESPSGMFSRVSRVVASVDELYGGDSRETEKRFFEVMSNLEFLPNSPTLMNAGTELGQLSACFVLPIEDSIDSIFTTLKYMAQIQQSGGGTGFSFSRLRCKGDIVRSTKGVASGPVSFMKIYDNATDVIKQGGRRRGANMGVLHCTHPDIEEFITSKSDGRLTNFNISVAATDEFMMQVERDGELDLRNPRDGRITKRVKARYLFDLICEQAWKTGDPGLLFIDEINRKHPLQSLGEIEATNPCGEVPLLPYESCILGSINLSKVVKKNGEIDWDKLRYLTRLGVHFLDNVIDANKYPLVEIEKTTKANRKIGLGVMGFADLLFKLHIPYDSEEALQIGEKIMSFISREAREKSVELGRERGSFKTFNQSVWSKKYSTMRNATCTTIAPTGTISIIAGCSSGIEPVFALVFLREVLEEKHLLEINEVFKIRLIKQGLYSDDLIEEISKTGSIRNLDLPEDIRRVFVTSLDIPPEFHVRMQSVFQRHVDNAVSKTVNLPSNASVEDVKKIYMLAWKLKCKGITVYRYGSKPEQVLYIGEGKPIIVHHTYSGGCPTGVCPL